MRRKRRRDPGDGSRREKDVRVIGVHATDEKRTKVEGRGREKPHIHAPR